MPRGENKTVDVAGGPLPGATPLNPTFNEKEKHLDGASTPEVVAYHHDDDEELRGEVPTEEEKKTLRHVGDPLPKAAFLVAIVELCERFTYYGASGIFQNYVQRPLDGSEGRGALGMGHQGATGLTTFFQFWCYGMFDF